MVLVVHEEDTHNNPNIQWDVKLWRRIRDYDKKERNAIHAKQKQQIKKQLPNDFFSYWNVCGFGKLHMKLKPLNFFCVS